MPVGFIGLGKMGRPMALNVLRAGFELVVHNRSRQVVDELVALGAHGATGPAQLARQATIILTCLPDVPAVEQVYLGGGGLVEAARAEQVFVDHSTVGPDTSRALAEALQFKGARFLDAPVSGGTSGAQAGTLTIMVGGDEAVLAAVKPLLSSFGSNIKHVGPIGAGSTMKLVNQLLVAINLAGVVEALVLGAKAGADPQVILDVIGTSFGNSAMLGRTVPLVLSRAFEPGTPADLILKDLGLVGGLARTAGVRLLIGALAEQVFLEARAFGLGQKDMAALIEPLERLSGIMLGKAY